MHLESVIPLNFAFGAIIRDTRSEKQPSCMPNSCVEETKHATSPGEKGNLYESRLYGKLTKGVWIHSFKRKA